MKAQRQMINIVADRDEIKQKRGLYFTKNNTQQFKEIIQNNFDITFAVVTNLSVPILIGFPTFEKLGGVINSKEKFIELAGKRVNYESKKNGITLIENILIPARSYANARIFVPVQESKKLLLEDAITVPGCGISTSVISEDQERVLIQNTSDQEIEIKRRSNNRDN